MDGMNRRRFLGASLDAAALATAAGLLRPLIAMADSAGAGVVLYDPRFAAAAQHAATLAGSQPLRAITGDPTELVLALAGGGGRGPQTLRGVTPESVPFCLSQLSGARGRPELILHRIDQDLFAWQLVIPT